MVLSGENLFAKNKKGEKPFSYVKSEAVEKEMEKRISGEEKSAAKEKELQDTSKKYF